MRYRKIFLVVALIALVSVPLGGQAYQIAPNPNYGTIEINTSYSSYPNQPMNRENFLNYSTIIITDIGYLGNSSYLYNSGTITNNRTLINSGTLINNSGGTLNNNKHIENFGTLNNEVRGTLNNNSGSEMYNDGTLNNSGTLNNNEFLLSFGHMNNSSVLNNYGFLVGNLNNNQGGKLVNYSGAILSTQEGTLNNFGTLINNLGGKIQIFSGSGQQTNSATLTNLGWITIGWGDTLVNSFGATLTNSGKVSNSSNSTLNNSGTLTNSGTMKNDRGATFNGTGTYTQTDGITITNGTMSQTDIDIQGGSMSGTGKINGEVNIASGATVHPGNSLGTLTINGTFSSSGTLLIDIWGLDEGKYSVLKINGAALFDGGNIEFDFRNYIPSMGDSFDFLFADTIIGWETLSYTAEGLGTEFSFEIESFLGGEKLVCTESPALPPGAAPIPGSVLLLGGGFLGLMGWRQFKKN